MGKWTKEARQRRSEQIRSGTLFTPFKYQGIDVGYEAKHKYIRELLGSADHCTLNKEHSTGRFEWANLDHKYSRNPADYIQLCHNCHRQYDLGNLAIGNLTLRDRGGIPLILTSKGYESASPTRNLKP